MIKSILNSTLSPLLPRMFTGLGAWFTGMGMSQPDLSIIMTALPIVAGFLLDLVIEKITEKYR